jgi:hypothetical protein
MKKWRTDVNRPDDMSLLSQFCPRSTAGSTVVRFLLADFVETIGQSPGRTAMNYTAIKPDQTEEENILMCDISDEALETTSNTERENAGKITWYYCPTGLTICRV